MLRREHVLAPESPEIRRDRWYSSMSKDEVEHYRTGLGEMNREFCRFEEQEAADLAR